MGDKYTEIAADRPGFFSCFVGKPVRFIDDSKLPMAFKNRPATVIYQTENFVVVAFDECDGWAPRVCSISDIAVIENNDCYEDTPIAICSVDECRNLSTEKLYITSGESDLDDDSGTFSVGISLCSDCYKKFISSSELDEMIDNVNDKYNVCLQVTEKNLE